MEKFDNPNRNFVFYEIYIYILHLNASITKIIVKIIMNSNNI